MNQIQRVRLPGINEGDVDEEQTEVLALVLDVVGLRCAVVYDDHRLLLGERREDLPSSDEEVD